MKVLLVSWEYPPVVIGGLGRHVHALSRELVAAGHEVVVAHDGREALGRFSPDKALDVLVMDVGLPDSDGRDVVQALKSAGQQAPVLFLTALG
ncbi:response regulator, partial [Mycolicibacterium poriferae]|uniref:response regulator n=1 Tax=Mycolicibacterium poriferae TaxID=39694 RepID=UPI0032195FDB